MTSERSEIIEAHDMSAKNYDDICRKVEWHGHEVLFGISYDHISPGESILDIAIGTGMSSYLFNKAGLDVYGIDNSIEMLYACKKKGFAKGLTCYDLNKGRWPYEKGQFHHAICSGLFHFYRDLDLFFSEVTGIIKPDGTFSFVVMEMADDSPSFRDEEYGIEVYRHSESYIKGQAKRFGFNFLKKITFKAHRDPEKKDIVYFTAYLLEKR
jgi:ubiquinone/menaquinone biosynthesis C-methylase UbiE